MDRPPALLAAIVSCRKSATADLKYFDFRPMKTFHYVHYNRTFAQPRPGFVLMSFLRWPSAMIAVATSMTSPVCTRRRRRPSPSPDLPAFNAAGAALLATAAAALLAERFRRRRDGLRRTNAPCTYDSRGHADGSPCVVLEAGANSWSTVWAPVMARLAPFARSFSYDRPGLGRAEFAGVLTVAQHADALHARLVATGAGPPYVLVAHSLGALFVNRLLQRLPREDVLGVVYCDGASAETVAQLRNVVPRAVPPTWLAVALARLGVLRALAPVALSRYADAFRENAALWKEARAVWSRAGWLRAYSGEWVAAMREVDEGAVLPDGWLGSMPITVIVPDVYERTRGKGHIAEVQARLSRYSSDSKVVRVEQCGHFVQLVRPDVVVDAVQDVVERAKKQRLTPAWKEGAKL